MPSKHLRVWRSGVGEIFPMVGQLEKNASDADFLERDPVFADNTD